MLDSVSNAWTGQIQHGQPPKRERETDKETGIEINKTVSHTDPGPSVLTDSDMGCTETYMPKGIFCSSSNMSKEYIWMEI